MLTFLYHYFNNAIFVCHINNHISCIIYYYYTIMYYCLYGLYKLFSDTSLDDIMMIVNSLLFAFNQNRLENFEEPKKKQKFTRTK